jgi:hypothetical protein
MRKTFGLTTLYLVGLGVCASALTISGQTSAPQANSGSSRQGDRVPVLVELFTSEGCSSCPPADALLTQIDQRQPFASVKVIAIEEHVDYWDQQGWKDPFSSAEWTFRQNEYTAKLRTGSSYTPEMVVDGTNGFTGNRGTDAKAAIEKAAAMKKANVLISEVSPPQNKAVVLKVDVEQLADATPKDTAQVLLAITETGLHSSVKDGENAGRELQHSPVLREMKTIGTAGKNGQSGFSGEQTVKLDSEWKLANLRAVVFVQEKKSRKVLGAAELPLAPQEGLR